MNRELDKRKKVKFDSIKVRSTNMKVLNHAFIKRKINK